MQYKTKDLSFYNHDITHRSAADILDYVYMYIYIYIYI